jgi:hypothetical protein
LQHCIDVVHHLLYTLPFECKRPAMPLTIAQGLQHRLGVRPEDVFITLVEVKKENWSFGNGIAQYAV